MKKTAIMLGLGLIGCFCNICKADATLGSWTFNTSGMAVFFSLGSAFIPPNIGFHFYFGGDGAGGAGSLDVGHSIWSTSTFGATTTVDASDPNFDQLTALLTDRVDDPIGFGITWFGDPPLAGNPGLATRSTTESTAFGFPASVPDFASDTITSVQFQFHALIWQTTKTTGGYNVGPFARVTESVIGNTPEPASFGIIPVAFLLLRPRRMKRATTPFFAE